MRTPPQHRLPSSLFFWIAATVATLTMILSSGCGGADPQNAAGVEPTTVADDALRIRPAKTYTPEELAALAETPEIHALNNPFEAATPSPTRSLHVAMADGTRLAVSLYFPAGFDEATQKAPVIYSETWYSRGVEATATAIDLYRQAGFVVAVGDPRGFGASFGAQPQFMTSDARNDQKQLLAWFAAQPWSSGQVAAIGMSISGTQAEAMAASGAPALKAAVIRASDWEHFHQNLFPGGIANPRMLGLVAQVTEWMRGEPCLADPAVCGFMGIAAVDGDTDFALLRAAFADHQPNMDGATLPSVVYHDDNIGGGSFDQLSAAGSVDALGRAAVPARVSASWLDGTTADSALARFAALPNVPMEVVIGATAHSGGVDADPFSDTAFGAARPPAAEQYAADVSFVRRVLAGEAIGRSVSYYVLGAGSWKTTPVWPPAGVTTRTLQLSHDRLVGDERVRSGQRSYEVDPTTSSGGPFNRWGSQAGEPVYYGDRRAAPGRRLAFESDKVTHDMELVGTPELCLAIRSDQGDGTVFAYLEDVAPNGRVTYLTEGELRLIHRKTNTKTTPAGGGCDAGPGTARSFDRADGAPVVPGQLMHVELPLLPTAARIAKNHRLRLSITGADAGSFAPVTDAPGTWTVSTGGALGSTLTVPVRAWSR